MKTKTVAIILSDVCLAECEICCSSCSPHNTNIMSEEFMINIIDQAKGKAKTIAFDGGEPFLHYELLKKGLTYAKESGFKTAVATNGFWGTWTDEEMSEKIRTLPIDNMMISTDSYHERFVPEASIGGAVAFTKKAKINLYLKIGETKSGEPAADYFNRMGAYKYLTNVSFYPFVRAGRAMALSNEDVYRPVITADDIKCPSNAISIRYDGEVFPCAAIVTHDTAFSIGNINRSALSDILEENAMLFSMLRESGGMRKLASAVGDELSISELCVSGCEICHTILENTRLRKKAVALRERGAL